MERPEKEGEKAGEEKKSQVIGSANMLFVQTFHVHSYLSVRW